MTFFKNPFTFFLNIERKNNLNRNVIKTVLPTQFLCSLHEILTFK